VTTIPALDDAAPLCIPACWSQWTRHGIVYIRTPHLILGGPADGSAIASFDAYTGTWRPLEAGRPAAEMRSHP
jgi:hypothetical protein